jgi:uncharacterized damage-inducible protein DinB
MVTPEGIKQFHTWTHTSLTILLDHLETLPQPLLAKELDGFGFASIQAQVVHLLVCELAWVKRLQQQRLALEGDEPHDVAGFRALQYHAVSETLAYLGRLAAEALNQEIVLQRSDGRTLSRTPAHVLHHVLTHAYHHKGQIVAMCRLHGYPAPDTDLFR